jgi:hypothetical protein
MRIVGFAIVTSVAFVATVSPALADSFCVADPACVSAGGTSEPDVQTALNVIKAGNASVPATLTLGGGTFAGPFSYFSARPLTITGSGTGGITARSPALSSSTTLQAAGDNTTVLTFGGNSSDAVSALTINVTSGNTVTGLALLSGASAGHVIINTPPSSVPATGVNISGGSTITKSDIEVGALDDNADTSYGVLSSGGSAIDSVIAAPVAFGTNADASAFAVRDTLAATDTGVLCEQSLCFVEDTVIGMSDAGNGFGPFDALLAECGALNDASIIATNDTILGSMQYGADAFGCASASRHTTITLDSSILMGAQQSLHAEEAPSGMASVTVTPSYDEYDGTFGQLPPLAVVNGPGVGWVNQDPMCITRDCGIGWNSPAVDAGNPAPLGLLDSTTDRAGRPRVVNGRRDIGAFEYQRTPPVATIHQSASSIAVGETVTFDATASGDPDRDPIIYAWRADDGWTGAGVTFSHAFGTPGTHTVTLTVTDTTNLTATATAKVTITPSAIAPTLTALRQSASKWRLGNALAHLTRNRKPPIGTTFSFKLNTTADVSFLFTHVGRCNPGHKRCTVIDGTVTLPGIAGAHRLSFDGLVSAHHRLHPGRYKVAVTASNIAGRSATHTLSFTVLRR